MKDHLDPAPLDFASDNGGPVHPEALAALAEANVGHAAGYGADPWTEEAVEHERRVRAHFAGRPDDLLVMDITAGDGWEQVCPFLGLPVPDAPFPRRG